jgi:hypothetical protein
MTSDTWITEEARATRGVIELFADRDSAIAGETVGLYVKSEAQTQASIWRLGAQHELVAELSSVPPTDQPLPSFEPSTGLVHCSNWSRTLEFEIGSDWRAGVYAVRLESKDGMAADALFIVRGMTSPDVTMVLPVTTWAAYNWWGGRSLYDGDGYNGLPRAYQVSLDRPMKIDGPPIWERSQGHPYFTWEYPFVRWAERQGYELGYATSADLHCGRLASSRLIVSLGHDEYWSAEMRVTLDDALAAGASLLVAGANEICWGIRFEPSALGENRVITCHKDPWRDPALHSDPARVTSRWGDWPLDHPESDTTGVRFVDWDYALNREPAAWIARKTDHPLFAGTGLRNGDRIEGIIGDEWDAYDPTSTIASRVTILGESEPLVGANLGPSTGHTVVYETEGGGFVFATGTTNWCWGLDASSVSDRQTAADPRLRRLTQNVFDAAIGGRNWPSSATTEDRP